MLSLRFNFLFESAKANPALIKSFRDFTEASIVNVQVVHVHVYVYAILVTSLVYVHFDVLFTFVFMFIVCLFNVTWAMYDNGQGHRITKDMDAYTFMSKKFALLRLKLIFQRH